jgi:hypothetical protein
VEGEAMRRCTVLVVAAALTVVLISPTAATAAVRPFDPPQTVVGGCNAIRADAVGTASGSLLGFASCLSPAGARIRFFSRNPDGTVNPSENSGFSGWVLGVTYDGTATYVLFHAPGGISIGKRTHAGVFSSRVVDPAISGATYATGDVIAKGGEWFGVWSKPFDGSDFAQDELFSAATRLPVRRVTNTGKDADDLQPTLAYSASTPVLIWGRFGFRDTRTVSDLYVSKFVAGNWQPERVFASAGEANWVPDVRIAGGRTFVTWERDGFIWVASNASGSFTSRMFNTGGFHPKVATSTTSGVVDHIFVAWSALAQDRVFFAESASTGTVHGQWDGTHIAPAGTEAVATAGFATKGTAVYHTNTEVVSRTQA